MLRTFSILFVINLLNACGPATIHRQTYEAIPYQAYESQGRKVFVGISATRDLNSKMPFYYSDFQGEPYSLFVLGHSTSGDNTELSVLRAEAIFPDREALDLIDNEKNKVCELTVSRANNRFNECYIYLPFGDSLKFKEGYEFTVKVLFKFSDSAEVGMLTIKLQSFKSTDKGTTFGVMMSV